MNTDERTMDCMEYQTMETNQSTDLRLNEVAAGMLNKTVDSAVAVTQFAVGTTIGVGQITLASVNQLFSTGTEAVNTQFKSMVDRIFGVKG